MEEMHFKGDVDEARAKDSNKDNAAGQVSMGRVTGR